MIEKINGKNYYTEFKSIEEFYKYLCDTPFNDAFRWSRHSSVDSGYSFTQTYSFEEAASLLKNGWDDMAKKLTEKLKAKQTDVVYGKKQKTVYDVCGYQASVPRYLQGIPTNMVNKINIPVKQKVITINKCVNYNGLVSIESIVEESIKALQIVKKLEAQGLRVNLNVILGSEKDVRLVTKVRIKSANERLNISKLAFCLVHPSMLRRLLFRYIEVYPYTTRQFVSGYGTPVTNSEMKQFCKGEYLIPAFVEEDVNSLKDMEYYMA